MEIAVQHGVRTIAFPSISTGIYGYPIELAASLAVTTVRSALGESASVEEVTFCCFSDADLAVYDAALAAVRPA
jgi:O-acetyl-ADP-ribose deacetylase (regulator of RNase III)